MFVVIMLMSFWQCSYPLCVLAPLCPETAKNPEGPADEWFLSRSQQLPSSPEARGREGEGVGGPSESRVSPVGKCDTEPSFKIFIIIRINTRYLDLQTCDLMVLEKALQWMLHPPLWVLKNIWMLQQTVDCLRTSESSHAASNLSEISQAWPYRHHCKHGNAVHAVGIMGQLQLWLIFPMHSHLASVCSCGSTALLNFVIHHSLTTSWWLTGCPDRTACWDVATFGWPELWFRLLQEPPCRARTLQSI